MRIFSSSIVRFSLSLLALTAIVSCSRRDAGRDHPFFPRVDWVQVSPDGRLAAINARRSAAVGEIFIVDLTSHQTVFRTQGTTLESNDIGPSWSPDSKKVAFLRFALREGGYSCMLRILSLDDGHEIETGLDDVLVPAKWIPGGSGLIATIRSADGKTNIFKLDVSSVPLKITCLQKDQEEGEWNRLSNIWLMNGEPMVVARAKHKGRTSATSFWLINLAKKTRTQIDGVRRTCYGWGVSPDGRWLAFVERSPDPPPNAVLIYDLSTLKIAETVDTPQGAKHMEWSPDSDRLLLWSYGDRSATFSCFPVREGALYLLTPATGKVAKIKAKISYPSSAAWMPDGKSLLVGEDGVLWKVDLDSGNKESLWKIPYLE